MFCLFMAVLLTIVRIVAFPGDYGKRGVPTKSLEKEAHAKDAKNAKAAKLLFTGLSFFFHDSCCTTKIYRTTTSRFRALARTSFAIDSLRSNALYYTG